jgi:hypothetical protein
MRLEEKERGGLPSIKYREAAEGGLGGKEKL